MEISWIKLKTKMFDDEKIQLIEAMPEADAILVIWIKLLILAGKANSNGYILLAENIPYSPEMLSTIFRRPLQIVKFALKILKDFGMIEVTESNVMLISNWEKHQNIEGLDRVREQNRLRQSKHRNKKPALLEENKGIVTLPSRDVTQQIKSKKENKTIDIGHALISEYEIPVKDQVIKAFIDGGYPEDEAKLFFGYYDSKGWLDKKDTPIKYWTSLIESWMLRSVKFEKHSDKKNEQKRIEYRP